MDLCTHSTPCSSAEFDQNKTLPITTSSWATESQSILSYIYTGLGANHNQKTVLVVLHVVLSLFLIFIPFFALLSRIRITLNSKKSTPIQSLITRLLISDLLASLNYPMSTFVDPSHFLWPLFHLLRVSFLYHSLCLASLLLLSLMWQNSRWMSLYRVSLIAIIPPVLRALQIIVCWIWFGGSVLTYNNTDLVYQSIFVFLVDVVLVLLMGAIAVNLLLAYFHSGSKYQTLGTATLSCTKCKSGVGQSSQRSREIYAVWTWMMSLSFRFLPLVLLNICLFTMNDLLDLLQLFVSQDNSKTILWITVYTYWIGVLPNACMGTWVWILEEGGRDAYRQCLDSWALERKEKMLVDLAEDLQAEKAHRRVPIKMNEKFLNSDEEDDMFHRQFLKNGLQSCSMRNGEFAARVDSNDTIPQPMLLIMTKSSDDYSAKRPLSCTASSELTSGKRTAGNTSFSLSRPRSSLMEQYAPRPTFPSNLLLDSFNYLSNTTSRIIIPSVNFEENSRVIVAIGDGEYRRDIRFSDINSLGANEESFAHIDMDASRLHLGDSYSSIEWPRLDLL